jgi:predicted ATP-dependent endonuclease of OLD family
MFGEGNDAFVLALEPGLTALVGENDNGKTSVIDALRLLLGTRDQESFRISSSDQVTILVENAVFSSREMPVISTSS